MLTQELLLSIIVTLGLDDFPRECRRSNKWDLLNYGHRHRHLRTRDWHDWHRLLCLDRRLLEFSAHSWEASLTDDWLRLLLLRLLLTIVILVLLLKWK